MSLLFHFCSVFVKNSFFWQGELVSSIIFQYILFTFVPVSFNLCQEFSLLTRPTSFVHYFLILFTFVPVLFNLCQVLGTFIHKIIDDLSCLSIRLTPGSNLWKLNIWAATSDTPAAISFPVDGNDQVGMLKASGARSRIT